MVKGNLKFKASLPTPPGERVILIYIPQEDPVVAFVTGMCGCPRSVRRWVRLCKRSQRTNQNGADWPAHQVGQFKGAGRCQASILSVPAFREGHPSPWFSDAMLGSIITMRASSCSASFVAFVARIRLRDCYFSWHRPTHVRLLCSTG